MGKNILLIEDDITVAESITYTLKNAGYLVETTSSGRAGVERALKTHPDLVIMDIILPDINGADAIAKIRLDPWGETAKVIVLSNVDPEQISYKLAHLNVLQYLLKVENTLDQIAKVVDKILK